MNERSSRSHTLFTMTVESRLREGEEEDDGTVRVATLVSGREEGSRLNRQVYFTNGGGGGSRYGGEYMKPHTLASFPSL